MAGRDRWHDFESHFLVSLAIDENQEPTPAWVGSSPLQANRMGTKDKRVDTYIAKSAGFAKPILQYLRELVHEGCPQAEETIKWSFPHFMYKGMFCSMAAFKQHCAFHFWQGGLVLDPQHNKSDEAMGQFGRITSIEDLPPRRVLLGYIKKAVQNKDAGVKPARPKKSAEKKELVVPNYFTAALKKNKKAQTTFDNFPYSHKKEYVEWITEAKTEETRTRRLQTTLEWLAEGKSRNWKYEKC